MTPSEMRQYRSPYESRETYMDMDYACDLCGGTRHVNAFEQHEDPIWLCPSCNEYVSHQPVRLAEALRAFTIGNVL